MVEVGVEVPEVFESEWIKSHNIIQTTDIQYSVGESVEVIYNCDKDPDMGTILSISREHRLDRCTLQRANGRIYSFFLDDLRKLGFYASQTKKDDDEEERKDELMA